QEETGEGQANEPLLRLLACWKQRYHARHCSTEITVTDLGASRRANLPFCVVAEMGLGATVLGVSKVFTLSTLGAVRVSPEADLARTPGMLSSMSAGWLGSTLVSSSQSLPDVSFAAMASTRGSLTSPRE